MNCCLYGHTPNRDECAQYTVGSTDITAWWHCMIKTRLQLPWQQNYRTNSDFTFVLRPVRCRIMCAFTVLGNKMITGDSGGNLMCVSQFML